MRGRGLIVFVLAVAACSDQAGPPGDPSSAGPVDFSISGTVSRANLPVPGAIVALDGQDGQSTTTNDSGRFALGGVTSGFHMVRVHADLTAGAFSEKVLEVF